MRPDKPIGNAVTLLHSGPAGVAELNVIKLVRFLGGNCLPVEVTDQMVLSRESLRNAFPAGGGLIASAAALIKLGGGNGHKANWRERLSELASHLLVYGLEPTAPAASLLRELTGNSLTAVERSPVRGQSIRVSVGPREICRQLAGVSFETAGDDVQPTFVQNGEASGCAPILSVGEKPFFVWRKDERQELFLLAGAQIADLDAAVSPGTSMLQFIPDLAPVMMFLRAALGERLWHNDAPTACLILDDPLLKRRYGFLDYRKLLELMERKNFTTSVAFIPWNHRRSDRAVAERLARRSRSFSLCVHGCDHTRGEFGSADEIQLRHRAGQALERMRQHRTASGLDFDPVMIFPQGIFSTAAMKALKSCGYLAAVNSTPFPVDREPRLKLQDLLSAAVTRFAGFPLFTRCYPRHLPELAFDLFLGKPALLVEHHGFFREGYEALAETVEKLQAIEPRLQWTNLASICSRVCWKRIADNADVHVLFFANRFELRNETGRQQQYVLNHAGLSETGDGAVTVNGRPAALSRDGQRVQVRLGLAAGEKADLRIEGGQPEMAPSPAPPPLLYRAKVYLRRALSEFRDNYLDRSPFLSNLAAGGRPFFARRKPATQTMSGS